MLNKNSPVAQLVERVAVNHQVRGSSPRGGAIQSSLINKLERGKALIRQTNQGFFMCLGLKGLGDYFCQFVGLILIRGRPL